MTSSTTTRATSSPSKAAGRRRATLCGALVLPSLLLLTACGGGGGGSTDSTSKQLGLTKVIVQDSFGTPVAGVAVQGPIDKATTDALGVALVTLNAPDSSATVTISRDGFLPVTAPITSSSGKVNEVPVLLERTTAPAGGSLSSRSGAVPTANATAQQLSFEVELVIVDGKSQPIAGLSAADFALRACAPNAGTDRNDCVNGATATADVGYTPVSAQPDSLTPVAGAAAATPYATALLLDQSGSISSTDPTGARLYSTKAFLKGLGNSDQALLAAFAGAPGTTIPTAPLSVYGPFRDRAAATTAYFPTLDALATQVGGSTPLYDSLDSLRQQMNTTVPPAPGLAKAVVIFTDGADTSCTTADACRAARERSIAGAKQDGVRLFTIGLSSGIDVATLGELANRTGGAFLYAENVAQLLPLYGSVGDLVSLKLPTYRLRWTISAAAAGAFKSGSTVLGQVQVKVGTATFDVPFIVGVP